MNTITYCPDDGRLEMAVMVNGYEEKRGCTLKFTETVSCNFRLRIIPRLNEGEILIERENGEMSIVRIK